MSFLKSTVFFAAGFAVTALLLFVVPGLWRSPGGPLADRLTVAGFVVAVTGIPAALAFGTVTSLSGTFRSLPRARFTSLGLASGASTYVLEITGLVVTLAFRVVPGTASPLVLYLRLALPGVLVGLLAVGAAHVLRPKLPEGEPPDARIGLGLS